MNVVKDFKWIPGMTVAQLGEAMATTGFQSVELNKATEAIVKMKKTGSTVFLTFTSNMVTSGLRGFFSQLVKLKVVDVIVTTVGGIEEDIMKANGENFIIGEFNSDDVENFEGGINRVGNLFVTNESYCRFEDYVMPMLDKLYVKQKRWAVSDMLNQIGLDLKDENSFLYQAAKNNVPVFCPAITDGSMGFHLFMYQEKHPDFIVDVVKDFKNILMSSSHDEQKGLIALGGSISKHHAILAALLNGGLDYAVYMTTARHTSGSMSGATTNEAKSWGKIKDDSDAATVIGDVSITFPIAMIRALEILNKENLISLK